MPTLNWIGKDKAVNHHLCVSINKEIIFILYN